MRLIAGVVVALLLMWALASQQDSYRPGIDLVPGGTPSAPEPTPAPDVTLISDAAVLRALRDAVKNPASFQLTRAIRTEAGALCVIYRATNSFNAVVASHAVAKNGTLRTAADGELLQRAWSSHCEGRTGVDRSGLALSP